MAIASTPSSAAEAPVRRIARRSVAGWVLYDLANTAFSLGIVTLYMPKMLEHVFGHGDAVVGMLDGVAAAVIFVLAPVLGAITDQSPRRLPFLAVSTILCITATFFLAQSSDTAVFVLFVVAVVCYQAGLIFYDSLLPEVSTDANRGRIGGIGVGVGYIGSLLAFFVGVLLLPASAPAGQPDVIPTLGDYAAVFRGIALVFLLFALPAFFFVRERRRVVPPVSWRVAPQAFGQLAQTAVHARRYRGLAPFLLGRMFYTDAANTLIAMVVLYVTGSLGMGDGEARQVAILSIVAAIPAGLAWGQVVDRIGPKRTLDAMLVLWMAVFAVVAAIPVLGLPPQLIYVAGVFVGIGLAGLWASDRPLMARLAPPRYYGQFFGLYAMVGRFSAVIGPVMWGVIADPSMLGWGQPAAVVFLLVWMLIAFAILRRVDDRPRVWGPEDLPELEEGGAR